jgi:hypothetical protein
VLAQGVLPARSASDLQSIREVNVLRRSILACGLLLAFLGLTTAAAAAAASQDNEASQSLTTGTTTTTASTSEARTGPSRWELRTAARWRRHIRRFRRDTRHWLTVMKGRPPGGNARRLATRSLTRLHRIERRWRHRAHRAWWRAKHPPYLDAWLCIHRYEGSWADPGSPYWGGLQMDLSFQQTYGGWLLRHKGTADHWSALEQIWVAVRAARSRGFSPWPNTARSCGVY